MITLAICHSYITGGPIQIISYYIIILYYITGGPIQIISYYIIILYYITADPFKLYHIILLYNIIFQADPFKWRIWKAVACDPSPLQPGGFETTQQVFSIIQTIQKAKLSEILHFICWFFSFIFTLHKYHDRDDRGHFWSKRARPGQFWSKRSPPIPPNHPSRQV